MSAMIASDVELDRAKWGWYGQGQTLDQAINILKQEYLDVRRFHLFITHNENQVQNYAIDQSFSLEIPDAQPKAVGMDFGEVDVNPDSGSQDDEYVEL